MVPPPQAQHEKEELEKFRAFEFTYATKTFKLADVAPKKRKVSQKKSIAANPSSIAAASPMSKNSGQGGAGSDFQTLVMSQQISAVKAAAAAND